MHLPGGLRRLVSFAPGTMLGEMAAIEGGARSADAVAETAVLALRLPVAGLQRLEQAHPQLAARLYSNIARHLSGRLRSITRELSAWTTRHAMQPMAGAFSAGDVPRDRVEGI